MVFTSNSMGPVKLLNIQTSEIRGCIADQPGVVARSVACSFHDKPSSRDRPSHMALYFVEKCYLPLIQESKLSVTGERMGT